MKIETKFTVCIENKNYSRVARIRENLPRRAERKAANHQMIRVVDESGEDYLYSQNPSSPSNCRKSRKTL